MISLRSFSFTALIVTIAIASVAAVVPYRYIGEFPVKQAGFLNLLPNTIPGSTQLNLVVSCFTGDPLGQEGSIYLVYDIGSHLDTLNDTQAVLATTYKWPNEVTSVPRDVFQQENLALAAGGFLVPPRTTGAISVVNISSYPSATYQLSTDKKNYFYHLATFIDMDGDGRQDILSARATKPLLGAGSGELVWLKNPGSLLDPWVETTLFGGPDIFFRIADVNNDNTTQLFAAQFFTSELVVYVNPTNDLSNPLAWKSRVIDNTIGALFDVKIVDLNGDGRVELLVTNHVNNATLSGVYAYEIPLDLINGNYTRHTITNNITTTQPGLNQDSPGAPVAFYPTSSYSGKPYILLAGDGSQCAYMITPDSEDKDNWNYTRETIIDVSGTVGQIVAGDTNNDGYTEFFVPDFNGGIIYGYTFKP